MSPNSYCLLSEEEQLSIGEIVASIANADMMADILIQWLNQPANGARSEINWRKLG